MWWGGIKYTVSGRQTPSPLFIITNSPNVSLVEYYSSLPLTYDSSIKSNLVEYYQSDWVKRTFNACYTCQACSKQHKLSPF